MLGSPLAHAVGPKRMEPRPPRALEDARAEGEAEDVDPEPLADAIAAWQGKKPQTAAFALHEMLAAGAWPDKESKIQYFLALSLQDLHMYEASGHYLVEVVKRGPADPWFALALPRLAALAAQTGDDADLARVAARIAPEDVPAAARDALAYLRGVRRYDEGDLTAARADLDEVAETSPLYPRARYLTGVILNEQDRLKSAAEVFRAVAASEVDEATAAPDATRMRDLSVLNLGRIYYGIERFDVADAWYGQVPRRSTYWPQSVFESAWANFMVNDTDRTLGQLLTLRAPSIAEGEFLPEAELLAALTWFNLCDFPETQRQVEAFEARYRPMHAEMKAFVQSYASAESRRLADQAYDRYFGPKPADTGLPTALFARVLRDRELAAVVVRLDAIDAEEALVAAQKPVWRNTVGADLLPILAADRERLKRRGGLALLREMSAETAALGDLLDQAEILQFERVNRDYVRLDEAAHQDPTALDTRVARADDAYSVSTDLVYWPFNGEFWDDELGSYRYAAPSVCR